MYVERQKRLQLGSGSLQIPSRWQEVDLEVEGRAAPFFATDSDFWIALMMRRRNPQWSRNPQCIQQFTWCLTLCGGGFCSCKVWISVACCMWRALRVTISFQFPKASAAPAGWGTMFHIAQATCAEKGWSLHFCSGKNRINFEPLQSWRTSRCLYFLFQLSILGFHSYIIRRAWIFLGGS